MTFLRPGHQHPKLQIQPWPPQGSETCVSTPAAGHMPGWCLVGLITRPHGGGGAVGNIRAGRDSGELGPLGCGAPRYLRTQRGTRAGTWSEQDHSQATSLCFPLGPQWGQGLKLRSGGPLRPHPTVLGSSCSLPCSTTTCGSPTPSRQGSAPLWPGTALAQSHRGPGASLLSRIPALPAGALGLIAGHPCPTLSLSLSLPLLQALSPFTAF